MLEMSPSVISLPPGWQKQLTKFFAGEAPKKDEVDRSNRNNLSWIYQRVIFA
jgi:hypothetical protein